MPVPRFGITASRDVRRIAIDRRTADVLYDALNPHQFIHETRCTQARKSAAPHPKLIRCNGSSAPTDQILARPRAPACDHDVDSAELKRLKRENAELRRANAILVVIVVRLFGFDGREVVAVLVGAAVVEPVDPSGE